jgi:hypothetical protein
MSEFNFFSLAQLMTNEIPETTTELDTISSSFPGQNRGLILAVGLLLQLEVTGRFQNIFQYIPSKPQISTA